MSMGIFETHAFQISVNTVSSVMTVIENKAKTGDKMFPFFTEG